MAVDKSSSTSTKSLILNYRLKLAKGIPLFWKMVVEYDFSLMEVGNFKECTASMRAVELVSNDSSFKYGRIVLEVLVYIFILPHSRHLANKESYVYLRSSDAAFVEKSFLCECIWCSFKLSY